MFASIRYPSALLAALCLCLPVLTARAQQQLTLLHNISGYTMNAGERVAFSALEFGNGVVVRTYLPEEDIALSQAERRIDGGGATVLPGLIDAHGHVSAHGKALSSVDLVGVESEQAAARRVADFIRDNPGEGWVGGRGWNQVLWPGRSFPGRASLDAVSAGRPVVLGRIDGHAVWANSRALELAGINAQTQDPPGGQIIRDDAGEPTGVLVDNAMDLVRQVIPEDSVEQRMRYQRRALEDLASLGLTAVHDAGVPARDLEAMRRLLEQGELPIRLYVMFWALDPGNDPYLERGPVTDDTGFLSVRSVKIVADGALGSRGAALHADYSDDPGNRGLLLLSDEELMHQMQRWADAGFQVNTHAIGDRANTLVLDKLEQLNTFDVSRQLRHRVEHAQILRPEDFARFAKLGVIASIQPTHATSDKNMAGDRLGDERLEGAYAWNTLLESGARLAGGSDFPVEHPNPFFGLHAAVTRQGKDNRPPGGWFPGQKISREKALSLFTEDAAFAAHAEGRLGRLLPGYAADFILVRDDYFEAPEEQLWDNQVLSTWVAGREVYRRAD